MLPFYKEPYENALRIERVPLETFQKVAPAIPEPIIPLHQNPPTQQHSLSQEASHLLQCSEPNKFFEAVFRPYEFNSIHQQMRIYRKQSNRLKWKEPTYEEVRSFIGLFMWTSLVRMPNRRSYFTDSKIYNLPHFKAHTTCNRFQQVFTMLHFTNNNQIPATLNTAQRFEVKLGNLLTAVNKNSASLLTTARALSIDEMMVKFHGRSVLRQYIKAKPHKYGIKLWAICCACCGYSLKQNIYLGSTVESVGGRDVVLQLTQPYLDKGHVIYCDRFFSHMDLAAYLRSRQTGMIGTSSLTKLPNDLEYLTRNMHPLTGQHAIPLISKCGYLRIFFHLLDTALVKAWILFRTTIQVSDEWNQAATRRYTLAWFKESVILSLCGHHTSRKYQACHTGNHPTLPIQSLELITQHQVQPFKNLLPDFATEKGRCLICKTSQRTACMACKLVYCYTCGRQHLHELLQQHTTPSTFEAVGEQNLPSILKRI